MPASRQIEVLTDRLSIYDLQFETDVIAVTTDGAKVMTKIGKLLKRDFEIGNAYQSTYKNIPLVLSFFRNSTRKLLKILLVNY